MATLAAQDARGGGLGSVTFTAAAGGGDQVPSGSAAAGWGMPVALLVRNGGVGAINVTVGTSAPLSVAAGATAVVSVPGNVVFGDLVAVAYSGVTSVTVAAVRL